MLAPIPMLAVALTSFAQPLALHPENPHYFLFRGRPTVLITSTEHYGAVLNLDFDAIPYLDELQARGLNLTRLFAGTYREVPGSFKIEHNTLAPRPGRYIAPWARTETPGAADGGLKFDLDRWDEAFFHRLKAFLQEASRRGIVVELSLFSPMYEDVLWDVNSMNAHNNVNKLEEIPRTEVYTLKHPALLEKQLACVRKLVSELNEFDNLYFEICNEPYFAGITLDWQARVAATIVETERALPAKHLIAQNIANGKARIETPNPAVSIFNFHYATPPGTVALNFGLNKVIADDETGFRGIGDHAYRTEAWEFLLAGGAVFDNLDYSFTSDHEDGTAKVAEPTPSGGGPALRQQLSILKRFLEGFDFVQMAPDKNIIKGGIPSGASARALAQTGKAYALYIKGGTKADLELDIPAGSYRAEWLNPRTGRIDKAEDVQHPGGRLKLASPEYSEDIALRVVAKTP
ncbi:MAG TPA: putative collagen-binding domain-containing protein [Isosphaeraceae bacterium]|jgi:hypothetical protein|nr:putative collagen-binding domain-containing protein [Isosphaeraceae bacterium]